MLGPANQSTVKSLGGELMLRSSHGSGCVVALLALSSCANAFGLSVTQGGDEGGSSYNVIEFFKSIPVC